MIFLRLRANHPFWMFSETESDSDTTSTVSLTTDEEEVLADRKNEKEPTILPPQTLCMQSAKIVHKIIVQLLETFAIGSLHQWCKNKDTLIPCKIDHEFDFSDEVKWNKYTSEALEYVNAWVYFAPELTLSYGPVKQNNVRSSFRTIYVQILSTDEDKHFRLVKSSRNVYISVTINRIILCTWRVYCKDMSYTNIYMNPKIFKFCKDIERISIKNPI